MSLSTATPLILVDPGFLFWAPLLSTEPAYVAAASSYDLDVWPVAWINLGATEDGTKFKYSTKVEAIYVAEFLDPIRQATTERSGSLAFNLANYTLNNVKRVFNGGTIATVSGTGATTSSSYVPPNPGAEIRCMLGWESLDHTMRLIFYQTINSGTVEQAFGKAPAKAVLPCEFVFEVPPGAPNVPWKQYAAGPSTGRLGT
jgi:hypothetical protein